MITTNLPIVVFLYLNLSLILLKSPSLKETNVRHSLSQLKDTNESENFPYDVFFEECHGIDDVVIEPTYMEFKDGSEGVTMVKALYIKNFGKKTAMVRFKSPKSLVIMQNLILKILFYNR